MTSAFSSGMEELQKAIDEGKRKAAAANSGGGTGSSLQYFRWDDGEKKILRFLADDMVTADFYDFIINKSGQTTNFMVNPGDPDRLKRYMSPTPGIGWRKPFKSDKIEEPKAAKKTVAVAVLREEKRNSEGKLVVEDYIYDREVNGVKLPSRFFGIVQQGHKNFWGTILTYGHRFGGLSGIDLEITRSGASLDTAYNIIPILPADPALESAEAVKNFYFYGQKWDKEDPQRFLKCPMTTVEWAEYFSSEERHQHWLTPDGGSGPSGEASRPAWVPPASSGLGEFAAGTTHNPAPDEAQAGPPPSATTFESLQDTLLKGHKS
jgi:hypothetical protein